MVSTRSSCDRDARLTVSCRHIAKSVLGAAVPALIEMVLLAQGMAMPMGNGGGGPGGPGPSDTTTAARPRGMSDASYLRGPSDGNGASQIGYRAAASSKDNCFSSATLGSLYIGHSSSEAAGQDGYQLYDDHAPARDVGNPVVETFSEFFAFATSGSRW